MDIKFNWSENCVCIGFFLEIFSSCCSISKQNFRSEKNKTAAKKLKLLSRDCSEPQTTLGTASTIGFSFRIVFHFTFHFVMQTHFKLFLSVMLNILFLGLLKEIGKVVSHYGPKQINIYTKENKRNIVITI